MIISATRSEESFPLSCPTSVTIITVHLATAIGGTCGVGCGEYFVVGLYWALEEDFANHPISAVDGARCWPAYRPSGSDHTSLRGKGEQDSARDTVPGAPSGKEGRAPRHRHLPTFRRPPRLFTSSFSQRKLPRICPHRRKLLHLS